MVTLLACSAGDGGGGDVNRGLVDDTLSQSDLINWPGTTRGSGRVVPLIRGFGAGRPAAYWFLGFASRRTADSFWFCREGDELCPLDENRRLNCDRLVGNPVFSSIPGRSDFSPFWQMWTVTVPETYVPNDAKKTSTINELAERDGVTVEPFIMNFDDFFGEQVGFQEVVIHCALVLDGTELEDNGGPMPDGSGPSLELEVRGGWFDGFELSFVDFTPSDGAFPESTDSENRPLMRFADIFIHWRRCDADPRPAICDLPGHAYTDRRPVSERGLGEDITGDADTGDTNNVMASLPCELPNPADLPYSPLWGPLAVDVLAESNAEFDLIDSTVDQAESVVMSADDIRENTAKGFFTEAEEMSEDSTGNPVPGNEGRIFFNCPNPVRREFVPHPCAE